VNRALVAGQTVHRVYFSSADTVTVQLLTDCGFVWQQ